MGKGTLRTRARFAVASGSVGLLLAGLLGTSGAAAHPHPVEDNGRTRSQLDGGEPGVQASSTEERQGVPRYFLRRDDCGSGADNLHLSLTAWEPEEEGEEAEGGDGCGFIPPGWNALNEGFAALGDEEGLVHDYPAADGIPFALDGSADITGTVVIQSFKGSSSNPFGLGAGISQAHFTLTGQRADQQGTDTLGQATEEYVVTPDQDTYEINFEMPAPAELDGTTYGSLNFRIRLDGPAANHGFIALSGRSFVDLPGTPGVEGPGTPPREVPDERLTDVSCVDGLAGPFECDGVDLLSFVPASEIDSVPGGVSDIWGWTDPESGDEYVMMGKTNGTAFFRVTDPFNPVYLGAVPNPAFAQLTWHDIKVYKDHAFIVSESEPHGMVVFDLTRLRDVNEAQEWDADAFYRLNFAAHNVAINEDTGFAYIVGGNEGLVAPDQCLSGLHMVDINEPTSPRFAGCYLEEGGPGTAARTVGGPVAENSPAAYVHDAQCVIYDGPDERYTGREICFNYAETKVVIADVTDKLNPVTVGVTTYENVGYTHQGWLTEDQAFAIANDELDEADHGINTRTIVFDVRDLENPKVHFEHFHETISPDHNAYVHEGLVYQSNYSSGLRVLDASHVADQEAPRLEPIGFFDTFPAHSNVTFDGTWSNYPFFESGTIAVSGRAEGLFLLRLVDDDTLEPAVEVTCANCPVEIRAGESETAVLVVSNVGDVDDTYTVSITDLPEGWSAAADPAEVAVAAGEHAEVPLNIGVPKREKKGTYSFTATVTSSVDPTVSASEEVEVAVRKGRPSDPGRPDDAGSSGTDAGVLVATAKSGDDAPSGSPMTAAAIVALGLGALVVTAVRRRLSR